MTNSEDIQISPVVILAGLGILDRRSLSTLIATIEETDMASTVAEAVRHPAEKLGIKFNEMANTINEAAELIFISNQKDHVLRHRLWRQINDSLNLSDAAPLSSRTAREHSTALALRISERLSPAMRERHRVASQTARNDLSVVSGLKQTAAHAIGKIQAVTTKADLVPFPELVQEEMLEIFANDNFMNTFAEQVDADTRVAIEKTRKAAQTALTGGLGWAAFAGIVTNAGFAPYIFAAQLSAWIPLVSGPLLVSFLAVIVNPMTLLAGISTIAWLGIGRQVMVVRSQMAARFCVLLSFQGSTGQSQGLSRFLTDMRRCVGTPPETIKHANKKDYEFWKGIRAWLPDGLPVAAGIPPEPLDAPVVRSIRQRESDINVDVIQNIAVGTVTAGEIFWHAVAIDDHVLNAADLSRIAELGNPLDFAYHARQYVEHGAEYALRGYTAEQIVLDHLVSLGHHVDIPPMSNTPGYDLLVDGLPVQVKCGKSLSLLKDHFEKNPDIPVIANTELVEEATELDQPWSHMVSGLPGFDLPSVGNRVEETLSHAVEITDLDVIGFGLAGGWVRGGYEVWKGRIPIEDLPAWLVINGIARSSLGATGAAAGTWMGLIAVGPAGAVILGPALAVSSMLAAPQVRDVMENALRKEWHERLKILCSDLQDALVSALERRIELLKRRQGKIEARLGGSASPLARWCIQRGFDDLLCAVEKRLSLVEAPVGRHKGSSPNKRIWI